MSKRDRGHDKGRLQPFVPLLKETLQTPAWRAMSHGARSLYTALRGKLANDCRNNGRVFISVRDACKETGSGGEQVVRWFRELQHFGFVVMTTPGCLSFDGKGRAPHWRLTELGGRAGDGGLDLPTRDFTRWNGKRFHKNSTTFGKQNPVAESRNTPLRKAETPPLRKAGTLYGPSVAESRNIEDPGSVAESRNISSNHLHGVEQRRDDTYATPFMTKFDCASGELEHRTPRGEPRQINVAQVETADQYAAWVLSCLAVLNSPPLCRHTPVNRAPRKVHLANKEPHNSFTLCEVSLTRTTSTGDDAAGEGGVPKRLHMARGHFKVRKTGIFWWRDHWRGDPAQGSVDKRYVVRQ